MEIIVGPSVEGTDSDVSPLRNGINISKLEITQTKTKPYTRTQKGFSPYPPLLYEFPSLFADLVLVTCL